MSVEHTVNSTCFIHPYKNQSNYQMHFDAPNHPKTLPIYPHRHPSMHVKNPEY